MAELRTARLEARNTVTAITPVAMETEKGGIEVLIASTDTLPTSPVQYSREKMQDFIEGTLLLPTWRVILLWYGLMSGLVLSIMDMRCATFQPGQGLASPEADPILVILHSVVSTATYTVAHDLDGGLGDATWIILAYTITYLGSTIIIARLSDVFGRRWSVTASFVIFIAASVGCGVSRTLNQLITFRAVQGIGGAGLYTMAMIVLPEISPIKLLPAISSLIGTAVAIASVLGPILGGTITQDAGWRW